MPAYHPDPQSSREFRSLQKHIREHDIHHPHRTSEKLVRFRKLSHCFLRKYRSIGCPGNHFEVASVATTSKTAAMTEKMIKSTFRYCLKVIRLSIFDPFHFFNAWIRPRAVNIIREEVIFTQSHLHSCAFII